MNLPKTEREQLIRMLEQGANRNFVESVAYESGIDFDDKYDQSFGRIEIEIEKENQLQDN